MWNLLKVNSKGIRRYTAVCDIILVSVSLALHRFHNCNHVKNFQTLISSSSTSSSTSTVRVSSSANSLYPLKNISLSGYWIFHSSIFKARFFWSSFESLSLVAVLYKWLRKSFFFGWKRQLVAGGIACPKNIALKILPIFWMTKKSRPYRSKLILDWNQHKLFIQILYNGWFTTIQTTDPVKRIYILSVLYEILFNIKFYSGD